MADHLVAASSRAIGPALREPGPPPRRSARTLLAIAAGAALLAWPALLNLYPILFSDTGGLLLMGLIPSMGWDKPWVYGPLLAVFHWRTTLWLPLAAQAVLISYMLWVTQAVFVPPRHRGHLTICAGLALVTTAPWVTSTLMPDLFTSVTILGVFILAYGPRQNRHARLGPHRLAVLIITAVAIAAHLSNLIVAAASIAAASLLLRALAWRPALALAAAIAFLLASNLIGHGRFGISPNGSVFALARLVGDGTARDYLDTACPNAGYQLCVWKDRLTADSDQFLWDPGGPLWSDDRPIAEFAAEASKIVSATIAAYPLRVLANAARNTLGQLGRFELGDTLGPDYLDLAVRPRMQAWFPPAELRRYDGSLQARALLVPAAQPFRPIHLAALTLAAVACTLVLLRGLTCRLLLADFTALILVALLANAFATGALSTIHDRYQSRAIWLVLIPPLLAITARRGSPLARNRSGSHPPPHA